MPLVGGFWCIELCRYDIRELSVRSCHYDPLQCFTLPGRVLVQHHLLHLVHLAALAPPGRTECPEQTGVVERSVSHLTPQSDLSTLGSPQSSTAIIIKTDTELEVDMYESVHIKTLL